MAKIYPETVNNKEILITNMYLNQIKKLLVVNDKLGFDVGFTLSDLRKNINAETISVDKHLSSDEKLEADKLITNLWQQISTPDQEQNIEETKEEPMGLMQHHKPLNTAVITKIRDKISPQEITKKDMQEGSTTSNTTLQRLRCKQEWSTENWEAVISVGVGDILSIDSNPSSLANVFSRQYSYSKKLSNTNNPYDNPYESQYASTVTSSVIGPDTEKIKQIKALIDFTKKNTRGPFLKLPEGTKNKYYSFTLLNENDKPSANQNESEGVTNIQWSSSIDNNISIVKDILSQSENINLKDPNGVAEKNRMERSIEGMKAIIGSVNTNYSFLWSCLTHFAKSTQNSFLSLFYTVNSTYDTEKSQNLLAYAHVQDALSTFTVVNNQCESGNGRTLIGEMFTNVKRTWEIENEKSLTMDDLQEDSFKSLFTNEFKNLDNYTSVLDDTGLLSIKHITNTLPSYLIDDGMQSMIQTSKNFESLQNIGCNTLSKAEDLNIQSGEAPKGPGHS
ncbi:MAG: hypothetical protein CMF41_00555 [Legionellales bacterium]|nr:hypothetical protein [Legionellales bacterium]